MFIITESVPPVNSCPSYKTINCLFKTTKRLHMARFDKPMDARHGAESNQTFHNKKYEPSGRWKSRGTTDNCSEPKSLSCGCWRLTMQSRKCLLQSYRNQFRLPRHLANARLNLADRVRSSAWQRRPRNRGSNPGTDKRFFCTTKRPHQPWGPPSVLFDGYRGVTWAEE